MIEYIVQGNCVIRSSDLGAEMKIKYHQSIYKMNEILQQCVINLNQQLNKIQSILDNRVGFHPLEVDSLSRQLDNVKREVNHFENILKDWN